MDSRSSAGTLQSQSTFSSGSRSGSSKSGGSRKLVRDEDVPKDNATSSMDLECSIQTERITKILDDAIYKVKQVICLPALIEDGTLNAMLTVDEYEDMVFVLEQYDIPAQSASLMDLAVLEEIEEGKPSLKNRLNPELGLLMYVLNDYPALKPQVEKMVKQMKDEYVSYKTTPPQPALEFLLLLEQFRGQVIDQMNCTAADQLAAKFNVRKCERSNVRLIKKIEEHKTLLRVENEKFQDCIAAKAKYILQLKNEIAMYEVDTKIRLQKQILDSDRQMVLQSRAHAVKYEIVKEEERDCRSYYENILKTNMIEEKKLRARKFKAEMQLQSWLQKYDLEMSDKQMELDEFLEKLEEENEKVESLEAKIAEQDKEYIPLMEEREKEYHQEMTEKMTSFRHEHAARVIQFAWKQVLLNRKEKKKLTRQVKQMQKAKAAAEAAAERKARREAAALKKAAKKK